MTKSKKRQLGLPDHDATHKNRPSKQAKLERKVEPTIPFDAEDRILLVGEGDFSFAKSIVEHHGCCDVTATCLDTKDQLCEKYMPQAQNHVQFLDDEGQTVLYGVDATKLDSNKALKKGELFHRILFNFPHVGGKTKDVNRQVRFNQELLVKFFTAAIPLLATDGTIIVTLFEGEPYTLWNIKDLARHSGLKVQRSFMFVKDSYPGYSHARTLGNIEGGGAWKGEDRKSRSYVFERKPAQSSLNNDNIPRRNKGREDASSDDGD